MQRRLFLQSGLVTTLAGSMGLVSAVQAANLDLSKMAGSVYYTKENPGRWAKKVAGHLPTLEKHGDMLKILTGHEMNPYAHYIVKHILLDSDFKVLGEKMFDPTKDKAAASNYNVKGYSGTLHALSFCNKHDTWLNSLTV